MAEVVSWIPSLWNTSTYLSSVINTIAADVLATQGARVSAVMVLTPISWDILVSAPEGMMQNKWINKEYLTALWQISVRFIADLLWIN